MSAELKATISADQTPFVRGLNAAKQSAASFKNEMSSGVVAAAGGLLAVGAIAAKTAEAFNHFADIGDLAERFNVSAEALQRWGFAAGQSGSSAEEMARAVQKMRANLAGASEEGSAAGEELAKYGINAAAVANMPVDAQLDIVADAMANAKTEAEKLNIAAAIFGEKLAQQMIPVLGQGSAAFRELANSAAVMDEATVASLKSSADEIKAAGNTMQVALGYVASAFVWLYRAANVAVTYIVAAIYGASRATVSFAEMLKAAFTLDADGAKRAAGEIADAYISAMETVRAAVRDGFGKPGEGGKASGAPAGEASAVSAEDAKKAAKLAEDIAKVWQQFETEKRKNDLAAMSRQERIISLSEEYNKTLKEAALLGTGTVEGVQKVADAERLRGEIERERRAQADEEQRQLDRDLAEDERKKQEAERDAASAAERFKSKSLSVSVDSLQRVGLGGGVGASNDKQLSELQRSREILADVRAILRDGEGKGSQTTAID